MTIGPRVIFDKSFIQSLSGPLIEEMTQYSTPTCPSTLISEIIADLKLPPRTDGRIGEDLVCQLAAKMLEAHGAQPAPLRSLIVGNLLGQDVPMHGHTVPVLYGSLGVYSDGTVLVVDQTVQQNMWARWAGGDFNIEDDEAATAWRAGIDATDLVAERDRWKPFAEQVGQPKSLEAVVAVVDKVMADPARLTQRNLISVALTLARADVREKNTAANYFLTLPKGATIGEYAPFAAHAAAVPEFRRGARARIYRDQALKHDRPSVLVVRAVLSGVRDVGQAAPRAVGGRRSDFRGILRLGRRPSC